MHGENVDAVDRHRRHPVSLGPCADVARRLARGERRLHRIEVVFAEEDHRQLLQRREVEAFGRHTFFGRRVAEEHHDDAIVLLHLCRERRAGCDRNGAPDDGRGARHADRLVDEVHRAAAGADAAVDPAMHLAQHSSEVAALGEIGAVRAMARVDEVGCPKRRAAPDGRRLLADDQVNRRLHLILMIAALDFLLDPADPQHRAVPRDELLRGMRMRDAIESGEPVTLVGIADRHRPFGWYSTMRPAGHFEPERHGDQIAERRANLVADLPAGRTTA